MLGNRVALASKNLPASRAGWSFIGKMRAERILLPALAMALGACNPSPEPSGDTSSVATNAAVSATATPTGTSSLWNNGRAQALEMQTAHPNGVVLQLTSLQTRATDTIVGVRVINGKDKEIDLNRYNTNRNGFLLLDTGERLYLSPPASNARLTIPAGQTFEGELVFLGRLPPIKSAVLVLNETSSRDNEYASDPGFRIDLPLSGGEAGASR